jgi:integrase
MLFNIIYVLLNGNGKIMTKTPSPVRRTLKYIQNYPSSDNIYNHLTKSEGWFYKTNKQFYAARDKALVCLMYLLALRVSEVLRLKKSQFTIEKDRIIVSGIELSKSIRLGKPRNDLYRNVNWLPLHGERLKLTKLVQDYLVISDDQLFKFGRVRAFQITTTYLGVPNHWLRAYGENYLYDAWDHDLLAVADYIKVDGRTLGLYIRKGFMKYQPQ